jgi:hypothetical protein
MEVAMQTTTYDPASGGHGRPYDKPASTEPPSTERLIDVGSHLRTWAGFKHLAVFFMVHVLVDLIGIYFFLMGDGLAGAAFVVIGTAILFYGVSTIGRARREEMRDPPV